MLKKAYDVDTTWTCGADLVVRNLEAQGVKHVFGIPGAKIDRVFDSLEDSPIETVVVRHEANAAFMAAAVGRLTGKAGVALVTSGPGCSNLTTGLATANSEGDAMVAIGGAVKLDDRLKQVHQTMDTVSLFKPITKYSAEVVTSSSISEVMSNAFRAAERPRPGAAFVSLPADVANLPATGEPLADLAPVSAGAAATEAIAAAAKLLDKARNPVLLVGLLASRPENAEAVRRFVEKTDIPVVGTYQAAGTIDAANLGRFAGRVGLWNNQPGDVLLDQADVVVTVGYGPVEYDPSLWNKDIRRPLIHVDVLPSDADRHYRPAVELVGDIAKTMDLLGTRVPGRQPSRELSAILSTLATARAALAQKAASLGGSPVHPLRIVKELQDVVDASTTMCVDMGSFHIWIARYLYSFRARQLLISNGQQTMGVALPWAIAASLVRPGEKVISVSGDGSFMQSSMELETAVRLKSNIVHVIWVDNMYNMVEIQEVQKYKRRSGVEFGPIDFKAYAESFGAAGFAVNSADTLRDTLRAALAVDGPAVVAIPVDYSDNHKLMAPLRSDYLI
ncbi:acetolactate synthase, large subunit (plasmid) [Paraburkholderia caribensis MBA4]|uniref:Acetolactate synthase, large subunit n=1 Tax=Paraburkholderia caribensis MBA4 TaxID=1323664 RepID=A0A0P0RN07_9BURK|nr:acetolactate synthase AlsS [Paraburkholderia caribensis]ALL70308.1 acetolactate synthase, large subunit [Paraburkholderia caribensis MBA4]